MNRVRGVAFLGLLLPALLLLSPAATQAQYTFGGNLGIVIPTGELGDFADPGVVVGAQVGFPLGELPITGRVGISHQRMSGPFETYFRYTGVDASAVYAVGGAGSGPYVVGGPSFYRATAGYGHGDHDHSDSETVFGIHAGGGFRFSAGNFPMFVEVRFQALRHDGETDTALPIVVGLNLR